MGGGRVARRKVRSARKHAPQTHIWEQHEGAEKRLRERKEKGFQVNPQRISALMVFFTSALHCIKISKTNGFFAR